MVVVPVNVERMVLAHARERAEKRVRRNWLEYILMELIDSQRDSGEIDCNGPVFIGCVRSGADEY